MRMRQVHISPSPFGGPSYNRDFEASNWRHKISATIGFDTASFMIRASKEDLEELFLEGCGRKITRYAPDGNFTVWEGYISEMILTEPGFQMRISLKEMANGIIVRYIPLDTTTNPPTASAEDYTTPVDDATSQTKYGVKQYVFTPPNNRMTTTDANQFANTLLAHYRMPIRSGLSFGNRNEVGLQVMCEGYMHTLDWHTYIQWAVSGTDNASTIISTIEAAVQQGFIASTDIDTNTTQVRKYYLRYDTGYDLIRQIASFGDSSYNRWLAYVLEDRVFHYKQASSSIKYLRRTTDQRQEFIDIGSGRVIPYWELRPNNWIRTMDVLPFVIPPASLKNDFQAAYIESIEWTEPDGLQIEGSTGDNLQVMIARMAAHGDMLL